MMKLLVGKEHYCLIVYCTVWLCFGVTELTVNVLAVKLDFGSPSSLNFNARKLLCECFVTKIFAHYFLYFVL